MAKSIKKRFWLTRRMEHGGRMILRECSTRERALAEKRLYGPEVKTRIVRVA